MPYTISDETQIKELSKQAFVELLQERKDLLYEIVAEVVEDFALGKAIKEGEETPAVHRDEVLQVLGDVS